MTRTALVTQAEAIETANIQSVEEAGGASVVDEAIAEAEEEVHENFGDPTKRSTFTLDSTQTKYEYRVDRRLILRIDRVWIRIDDNSRREYTGGTASETNQEYTLNTDENSITFHSDTVGAYNGFRVEVHYVLEIIHKLARSKAALYLLDSTTVTNAEDNTPTLATRIFQRIQRLEKALMPFTAVGSEDEKYYDPTFGDVIPQRRFRTY